MNIFLIVDFLKNIVLGLRFFCFRPDEFLGFGQCLCVTIPLPLGGNIRRWHHCCFSGANRSNIGGIIPRQWWNFFGQNARINTQHILRAGHGQIRL